MTKVNLGCALFLQIRLDGFGLFLEGFEALDLLLLVFHIDFFVNVFFALFCNLFAEKFELPDLLPPILPVLVAINHFLDIYQGSGPIMWKVDITSRAFLGVICCVERDGAMWLQIVVKKLGVIRTELHLIN